LIEITPFSSKWSFLSAFSRSWSRNPASPNLKDISNVFVKEFKGMTFDDVSLEELYDTRRELIDVIHQTFKEPDKKFLLTFKSGDPDWSLLNIDIARELPSVRWKLRNIRNMRDGKREAALRKLEAVLR
jgi:hypothetical protein